MCAEICHNQEHLSVILSFYILQRTKRRGAARHVIIIFIIIIVILRLFASSPKNPFTSRCAPYRGRSTTMPSSLFLLRVNYQQLSASSESPYIFLIFFCLFVPIAAACGLARAFKSRRLSHASRWKLLHFYNVYFAIHFTRHAYRRHPVARIECWPAQLYMCQRKEAELCACVWK